MKNKPFSDLFFITALVSLFLGLLFGLWSGLQYVIPGFAKNFLAFNQLRPLHTLLVISWILLAAIGNIYRYLNQQQKATHKKLMFVHYAVLTIIGLSVATCYANGDFSGKEYLEFPTVFFGPILFSWVLFGFYFFKTTQFSFKNQPVYVWMWATGILFMIYHFAEAHLWLLPYFKGHFIQNMALQWKSGGSYVGAWNMLVYGTSLYIAEQTTQNNLSARSPKAFFFYFLGLTNLMFGWAHHVYLLPTAPWLRYLAYAISMTEWLVLWSILKEFKSKMQQQVVHPHPITEKILHLSSFWVLLNIILALLISIPALNLFTHGTHTTVAHSMGTTIGINTLILLASISFRCESDVVISAQLQKVLQLGLRVFKPSFFVFWCCLLLMGIRKTLWLWRESNVSFAVFQKSMLPFYWIFLSAGIMTALGLTLLILSFLKSLLKKM